MQLHGMVKGKLPKRGQLCLVRISKHVLSLNTISGARYFTVGHGDAETNGFSWKEIEYFMADQYVLIFFSSSFINYPFIHLIC